MRPSAGSVCAYTRALTVVWIRVGRPFNELRPNRADRRDRQKGPATLNAIGEGEATVHVAARCDAALAKGYLIRTRDRLGLLVTH